MNSSEPSHPQQETPQSSPTLAALDSLNDLDKVKAIGELSDFTKSLNSFQERQLATYNSQSTPPDKNHLMKQWEKEFKHQWSLPEVEQVARLQIDSRLSNMEIELRQNHELTQIDSARTAWNRQIGEARAAGDHEAVTQWENLGKGVFFTDKEEERQHELTRRFDFLNQFKSTLSQDPAQALDILEKKTEKGITLPPTVHNYLKTQANSILARRQESFSKSLIENELNGTPLKEDALRLAVEKNYLTQDQANTYLEKFQEDRPFRNHESIQLPLLTQTRELIDSYNPDDDIKGQRKRSIYNLIAMGDYNASEKKEMLLRLDQQTSDPNMAKWRNKAASYIGELYNKNGLGAYTSREGEEKSASKEQWLSSQKKLNAAQQAVSRYLESKDVASLSQDEWDKEIPGIIYKATREKKKLNFPSKQTIGGYPLSAYKAENTTHASLPKENSHSDSSWEKALDTYFSSSPSPKNMKKEISDLFSNWVKQKNMPQSPPAKELEEELKQK